MIAKFIIEMIYIVILCIISIISTTYSCNPSPVVKTDKGLMQGCVSHTYNNISYFSFKGIPYARAPIGRNRFKPPENSPSWSGVLKATIEGSSCPQFHPIDTYYTGDEDCLYLNVYTPKHDLTEQSLRLPVLVWIHGGSYKNGAGNESLYGPDNFIENNIVVVTINYRLGALGFLALRHPDATGNAGLKDQNAALKWVQRNIANFGGDPQKVTISGQSAGSFSVSLHTLSPKSKGLFRSSILMSGVWLVPAAMYCLLEAEKRAFKLGSLVGCKAENRTELLNCLYSVAPQDLVTATEHITTLDPPFKATVEDSSLAPENETFLWEYPIDIYKSGKVAKLPQIVGYARDEALEFVAPSIANTVAQMIDFPLVILSNVGKKVITSTDCSTYTPLQSSKICSNKIKMNLLSGIITQLRKILYHIALKFLNIFTETVFIAEIELIQTEDNYLYELTFDSIYSMHRTIYDIQMSGAAHSDDTLYIFEMNKEYMRYKPLYTTGLDNDDSNDLLMFKRKMSKMWANFVTYNDPTPYGANDTLLNVKWLPTGSAGYQLELNKNLVMKPRQTRLITLAAKIVIYYFLEYTFSGCDTVLCTIVHLP